MGIDHEERRNRLVSVVGPSSFEYQPGIKSCQEGVGIHWSWARFVKIPCNIQGRDSRLLRTKYREIKMKFSGIVP